MAKYNNRTYKTVSFRGGSNIYINLITCKDNIVIPSIPQSYVLNWHHTYILHPVMTITEVIIHQHLYCPNIIDAVRNEVTNCDTCQRTKLSNKNMVNYQIS